MKQKLIAVLLAAAVLPNPFLPAAFAQSRAKTTTLSAVPEVTVNIPLKKGSVTLPGRPLGIAHTEIIDPKESDTDPVFDYTETYVTKQGQVSVTTTDVSVTENTSPAQMHDMSFLHGSVKSAENGLIPCSVLSLPGTAPDIAQGYDFAYVGSDQLSHCYAALAYQTPDPDLPETPIYTDSTMSLYVRADHAQFIRRGLTLPKLYLPHTEVAGNFPARYDSVQQFTLMDRSGRPVTAYCADMSTHAAKGHSYKLTNLKDADYYTPAQAAHIYTAVQNGYFGTQSGYGSLSAMKQKLKASGQFTENEIAAINNGIAMTATQYAIWSHSNKMDGTVLTGVYHSQNGGAPSHSADPDTTALIIKLYRFLASLPAADSPTTVINRKNFLSAVALTPRAKTENGYRCSLDFTLSAAPAKQDDLIMHVVQGEKVIASGRIAGNLQSGELAPAKVQGSTYTFADIPLQEGAQTIQLLLTGSQTLQQGAYLLQPQDASASQTMLCVAEGVRDVNVQMDIDFDLHIEDELLEAVRYFGSDFSIQNPDTAERFLLPVFAACAGLSLTTGALLYKKRRR